MRNLRQLSRQPASGVRAGNRDRSAAYSPGNMVVLDATSVIEQGVLRNFVIAILSCREVTLAPAWPLRPWLFGGGAGQAAYAGGEVLVDAPGGIPAFGDGPDYQGLAAHHIAGGEHAGD